MTKGMNMELKYFMVDGRIIGRARYSVGGSVECTDQAKIDTYERDKKNKKEAEEKKKYDFDRRTDLAVNKLIPTLAKVVHLHLDASPTPLAQGYTANNQSKEELIAELKKLMDLYGIQV